MKRLNATFDIENDLSEQMLRNALDGLGVKYVKTLPCTEHLKDMAHYKELKKQEKHAKDNLWKFINNNRI